MSAIAMLRANDAVVFASDGIAYDNKSIVRGQASKVVPFLDIGTAIGACGMGGFPIMIRHALADDCLCFDDVLRIAVERTRAAFEVYERADYPYELRKARVVFAGWSDEEQRFATYRLNTSEHVAVDRGTGETITVPAWRLEETPIAWASPWPTPEAEAKYCRFGEDVSFIESAARLVCAARQSTLDEGAIGRFLQITVLKRDGAYSWIAHRWPDPIGESVDVSCGEALPEFPLRNP